MEDISQPFAHPNKKKKLLTSVVFEMENLSLEGRRGFYKGTQVTSIYLLSPFYKSIL